MNLNTVFRGPATVDPPYLTVDTEPAAELLTHSDAVVSSHLRRDNSADDTYVDLVLKAARRHFERLTGLALINTKFKVTFDSSPIRMGQYGIEYGLAPSMSRFTGLAAGREIKLGRAPLVTVDEFKYLDQNGALQTFDPSNYTVGSVGVAYTFGRLWLNDGADWPDFGSFPGALQLKFTAGYHASDPTKVPEEIRMAVLWLAAHWYEQHLPTGDADTIDQLPFHLFSMIDHFRVAHTA